MGKLLQYGSQGNDVKTLQQNLNNQGYKLSADGIFGKNTLSAVKDFQKKNGLTVDGIAGTQTLGMLDGGSGLKPNTNNSKVGTNSNSNGPTLLPTPTNPAYDSTSWDDTEKGKAASGAYEEAKNALSQHGDFVFSENEWLEGLKDSIKNYGDFSYDVNSDALYQQYADQYMRQGKLASADVMGQAAAMTGGYGNSYAASVGNQAYQSYLQQLNDKVPELYQLALDRYNMGKQDLYDQYGMLLSEYEREYGLHSDEYNKLLDDLGIARDDYYSGADMFYTEQGNKNNVLGQEFNDEMAIWEANNANAWKQAEWDESARRYVNEEIWRNKQWDAAQKSTSAGGSSSGGYSSGGTSGGSGGNTGGGSNGGTTSGVSDSIKTKAASFTDNDALNAYLTSQYNAGKITEEQMGELYLENEISSLQNRNWQLTKNGGWNWFGGIDNNAEVKDQYGNTYSMNKLVDALVAEGMSKKDAKAYVKNLQKEIGA